MHNELENTAYQINKSKFFGQQPDEKLSMKKDAEMFYSGAEKGSPVKVIRKMNGQHKENTHTNIRKSLRSPVGKAGKAIIRSSSVAKIDRNSKNRISNPIFK